jgi:uncharacterized protein YlzI (FlbEa/FlbD family)
LILLTDTEKRPFILNETLIFMVIECPPNFGGGKGSIIYFTPTEASAVGRYINPNVDLNNPAQTILLVQETVEEIWAKLDVVQLALKRF